jgi:uncharacterized protein (DUF1778 family)
MKTGRTRSITFRIGPEQKAELTKLAQRENKPVGDLMLRAVTKGNTSRSGKRPPFALDPVCECHC